MECNMQITNTKLQNQPGKLRTFISAMTSHKLKADYILVNKKWSTLLREVSAYNTFSSIVSEHIVLRAKIMTINLQNK